MGGVVDVVTRKSRGCARRRISRRVFGAVWIRLQIFGLQQCGGNKRNKSKGGVAQGVWGEYRGGVVKSTKWEEAGLACLGLGVSSSEGSSSGCAQSRAASQTVTFGTEYP